MLLLFPSWRRPLKTRQRGLEEIVEVPLPSKEQLAADQELSPSSPRVAAVSPRSGLNARRAKQRNSRHQRDHQVVGRR